MAKPINITIDADYISSLYDALETEQSIDEILQTIEENQDSLLDSFDDAIIMLVDAINRETKGKKMENEYVDDWSCKECGHTGISEAENACPECDSTWAEQND